MDTIELAQISSELKSANLDPYWVRIAVEPKDGKTGYAEFDLSRVSRVHVDEINGEIVKVLFAYNFEGAVIEKRGAVNFLRAWDAYRELTYGPLKHVDQPIKIGGGVLISESVGDAVAGSKR